MGIVDNALIGASGQGGGYLLNRSVRTRGSASAYLSRTPASAGNRKTWTYSIWFKRGAFGSDDTPLFNAFASNVNYAYLNFRYAATPGYDTLEYFDSNNNYVTTSQVFRDPSGWYHAVLAFDTTQATAANRIKLYINGTQVTAFSRTAYPTQNTDSPLNQAIGHNIARWPYIPTYFTGYITEVNFIDGQALTPSSFGAFDTLTGVWGPKKYNGAYGTNGFYLPFTDNSALTTSSNVGLGKDFSGNGNYWATTNISITAGITYDSMTDVPTLTSATAANFCVLNPLSTTAGTYSNANLRYVGASAWRRTNSTLAVSSGKFYWEVTVSNAPYSPKGSSTAYNNFGFGLASVFNSTTASQSVTDAIVLGDNGYYKNFSGAWTDTGVTISSGDVLAIAVDLGANTFSFYRNNLQVATGTIGVTAGTEITPIVISYDGSYGVMDANFGQRPFVYSPPSGYTAINTYNLPTSTIVKGNAVMDATLYTGNGGTQTITNTSGFKPDLIWIKARSSAQTHDLTDSVRGIGKPLFSNLTNAEGSGYTDQVTAFNSNGFSLGDNATGIGGVNTNAVTYVGWQWQAGQGTTSTNTSGSITSTVSVNASAGFSVVTYTGTGANATIGHGLGVAPSLIIIKARGNAYNWMVYHSSVGNTAALNLNLTAAPTTASSWWNNTSPTSSVFTVGTDANMNQSSATYVAYCWTPVAGLSAMGSYIGNGVSTGPFIYCGFQPKWILIRSTTAARSWCIWDTARNPYNLGPNGTLFAESSSAEYSGGGAYTVAVTSNGFYLPVSTSNLNGTGETMIYAAFATNPFKNSLAF